MPIVPPSFVYLASQSPRRAALLDQIGVPHRSLAPYADEDAESLEALIPGEAPQAYVERVVRLKLQAAQRRLRARGLEPAPVLCADTTVALGRRVYGKPADAEDACRILAELAGRTHRVITGVGLAWGAQGRQKAFATQVSRVRFAPWPAEAIARYVSSGEPMGKAGAYGIQGLAAAWIDHIAGSHSGIMGLPLHETAGLLAQAGVRLGLRPS